MRVLAENIVEVFIPDELPQSRKRGSKFLFSLRRRSKHLKNRILEHGECNSTDHDREERTAIEWAIAHVINLEESLPSGSVRIPMGRLKLCDHTRRIPNPLPISGELGAMRLTTLRRHAEFLRDRFMKGEYHDLRGGSQGDRRDILTIESVISHILSLENHIVKKNLHADQEQTTEPT